METAKVQPGNEETETIAVLVSKPSETATVQHVNKASSDQLLRKFAELDSDDCDSPRKISFGGGRKRRKRSRITSDRDNDERPVKSTSLVERKALLPPANRRAALIRQLGIGKPGLRAREIIINGLFLAKLEKTWRRTIEGASKMFVERHCHQHMRLRNEINV